MSTQDKVQLSEREQRQFAGMKAMLEAGDPRLARVLNGQRQGFHAAMWVVNGAARSCARVASAHVWVGPSVVLAGFALVLAALVLSMSWLGVLGELLTGVGVALCWAAVQRRHTDGGAGRRVDAPVSL